MTVSHTLLLLPERYGVVKLAPGIQMDLAGESRTDLLAVIHTPEETTVVCKEHIIPKKEIVEKGWRALKVAGVLEFELVGVLASLLSPLAEAGVSVFTLSTYSTDFILVKGDSLDKAIETLKKAGHRIIE